jgi:4-hydroxy-tetrahydrodipicolinate synthase
VVATSRAPVLQGVGVALVTLFDDDLHVDGAATGDLAARVVAAGVRGVLVAGSTGEAPALERGERAALVREVRAAVPADVPVLAGTGAPSARQAVALTLDAAEAGADAALVLSPPRVADPRPHYAAVAAAVADDLPLLAYHFPAASLPGIDVGLLADLPVRGLKDSTGDPGRLLAELTGYDGEVYVGSSALVLQAGLLGCPGVILALANSRPEDCVAAFGGDAAAQLALAADHLGMAPFPQGIKSQVARRWGASAAARLG